MEKSLQLNSRNRCTVLGYPVDVENQSSALALIDKVWQAGEPLHVVTLNAEMVMQSRRDPDLAAIIKNAGLIVPDGAGVLFAIRLKDSKHAAATRLPGIELADATLHLAAQRKLPVALIGGRPQVMEKLLGVLAEAHPGLQIQSHQDGFFKSETEAEMVASIAEKEPRLVLVALGVPKQEFFIARYKEKFPKAVMIGVGGSFDVWTGFVERAPKSYQDLHLEWLYRLKKEPWRFRRMASTLPPFAFHALLEIVKTRLSPKSGDR